MVNSSQPLKMVAFPSPRNYGKRESGIGIFASCGQIPLASWDCLRICILRPLHLGGDAV